MTNAPGPAPQVALVGVIGLGALVGPFLMLRSGDNLVAALLAIGGGLALIFALLNLRPRR